MPRTFGDALIHQTHIDAMVQVDTPLPEVETKIPTKDEEKIGELIADNLVQDGATLQMGKYIGDPKRGTMPPSLNPGLMCFIFWGNLNPSCKNLKFITMIYRIFINTSRWSRKKRP